MKVLDSEVGSEETYRRVSWMLITEVDAARAHVARCSCSRTIDYHCCFKRSGYDREHDGELGEDTRLRSIPAEHPVCRTIERKSFIAMTAASR